MKKKVLSFFVVLCLIIPFSFLFVACGDKKDDDSSNSTPQQTKIFSGLSISLKENSEYVLDGNEISVNFNPYEKISIPATEFIVSAAYSDGSTEVLDSSAYTVTSELDLLIYNIVPAGNYLISFKYMETTANITVKVKTITFDASNFAWDYSIPFEFDGTKKEIKLSQESIEHLSSLGLVVLGYENNYATVTGEYVASATLGHVSGSFYADSYESITMPVCNWKINAKNIDMSAYKWNYEFAENSFTYDGTEKRVYLVDNEGLELSSENNNLPKGVTGIRYENNSAYEVLDNALEAVAYVDLLDSNYQITQSKKLTWNIAKKEVDLSLYELSWNYDDSNPYVYDHQNAYGRRVQFAPTAGHIDGVTFKNVEDGTYSSYQRNACTYYGKEYYTAKYVAVVDSNHKFKEGTQTEYILNWRILPETYVINTASLEWSNAPGGIIQPLVYSGSEYSIRLVNTFPDGITPVYHNNKRTIVGSQIASVSFNTNGNFYHISTTNSQKLAIVERDFVSVKTNLIISGNAYSLSESVDQTITFEKLKEIKKFPVGTSFEMTALGSYYFGEYHYSNETSETVNVKTKNFTLSLEDSVTFVPVYLRSTIVREALRDFQNISSYVYDEIAVNGVSEQIDCDSISYLESEGYELKKTEDSVTITLPENMISFHTQNGHTLSYIACYTGENYSFENAVAITSGQINLPHEKSAGVKLYKIWLIYDIFYFTSIKIYDFSHLGASSIDNIFSTNYKSAVGTSFESASTMFTTRNDSSVGFDFYMYITLSTVTTGINVSFKDEYSTYGYKLFNEDGVSEFNFTNVEAREYYLILKIFDNAECTGNVVEERIVYADYSIFVASNYVFASAGEYTLAYSSNIWSQKFDDSNASKGTLSADNKTISNLSNVNVLSVTSKAQMLDGTIYKVKSKIVVNTTKSISEYLAVKTLNFGTDETQIRFDIENKSNSPISNEVASKVLDQVNNAGYVTIDDDCWKNTETYSYILNSYSAEMLDGYLVIKLNITKTETLVPENTETSEFHLVLDVQ